MLTLRKILFYLFTLVYLLVCPLIIFYALGFIFKPEAKRLVKTGLIDLASIPPGASIYLNHALLPNKTPATIRGLGPGEYELKITLKNHKPWQKIIPVEEERATTLNVLLLPQPWQEQKISLLKFNNLIPLEESPFLLAVRGPRVKDIYIYRWKEGFDETFFPANEPAEGALHPLLPEISIYRDAKLLSCYTVKGSRFLLLHIDLAGEKRFLWVDLEGSRKVDPQGKIPKVEDITDLFLTVPQSIRWEPQDPRMLFSYQDQYLDRLDTAARAVYPKIAQHILNFTVFNKKIYALTSDRLFISLDFNGENQQLLLKDAQLGHALFDKYHNLKITVLSEGLILFLAENGELLCNRLPYHLVKERVKNFIYNPVTKRVLFWTDQKIGILDFRRDKEGFFEQGPELAWIVEDGRHIDQAFWVNQGAHILYRDRNFVFMTENLPWRESVPQEILKVKDDSDVYYSERLGKLFYLDAVGHNLRSVGILPTARILLSPEKEEENGTIPSGNAI